MSSPDTAELIETSVLGGQLRQMLEWDIQPGSDLSYEMAKAIYLWHPLGQKMAESPVSMAQSQKRLIAVQEAPEEVTKEFEQEWERLNCTYHIHNTYKLSRVYGISSVVLGCEGAKPDTPLDPAQLYKQPIYFNVLDPLNTAGSLVLSQVPNSPDFNKPATVRVMGESYHRSRYQVVQNEAPVYLAFTTSAFGFTGRSVYQRALYPLKSFLRSMIADDMIATKLALLVAKQKSPGSIVDQVMALISSKKRALLKQAKSGQVLSIDVEEEVETLNMQNVDGAGTYSRGNILKNIATAADMPARLLDNETLVEGFGEGTEDAKNIARYVDRVRLLMDPLYRWFDTLVQYRVWNPEFYERLKANNPGLYGSREYADVFGEWRRNYSAEWPSVLTEPESEQIKTETGKHEALIATAQTLMPELDPSNKARLMQWVQDNLNENERMFPHGLQLDFEELEAHLEEVKDQEAEALAAGGAEGEGKTPPLAKHMGSFKG